METQNLWPEFTIDKTKSPKAILKEQAGYLMKKTNNVLSAEVETVQAGNEQIIQHFYIVAPAINNYRYMLFSVRHKIIGYYPVTVVSGIEIFNEEDGDSFTLGIPMEAKNEEEFIKSLSTVFNDPDNTRIISSLLSQSLAE
ncbi:hypothetical protein EXU85_04125 [Spirosoma sp. KCTC 42546]|uniref:hypothetical protein n=1 Tax=Spirosoma sp. KCTC 42546 TaxID=2520506 RepID=UPI001157282F|nr:hypothetical protein [Spirosoma sp. KCTC 42546]QDK77821.1 hypothetical protein EXU85_04125 [Spirosoma sp. KCTC 42546]